MTMPLNVAKYVVNNNLMFVYKIENEKEKYLVK